MPGPYRSGPKRKVVLRMEAQFEALSELAKSGQQLSFGQDFFVKFYQAFLYADRWQQYIKGVGTTLLVTAIALVLGVALGAIVAMIRVGYRGYTEGEIQPDDYFTQNIEGALAAGLDVGVYFFSQALDEKEAIDEANFVLESIKDYPLSYPVIFDWEDIQADARTDGMNSVQLTKNALAFCSAIEKAGYRAGVYFNQRFGYEEFDLRELQDYELWLAEYALSPSFPYHFDVWQYANDGMLSGVDGPVDLNLAFVESRTAE